MLSYFSTVNNTSFTRETISSRENMHENSDLLHG